MEGLEGLTPARRIKKIRKKLRQIENLLLLDRELNNEEVSKVEKRSAFRKELGRLLRAQKLAEAAKSSIPKDTSHKENVPCSEVNKNKTDIVSSEDLKIEHEPKRETNTPIEEETLKTSLQPTVVSKTEDDSQAHAKQSPKENDKQKSNLNLPSTLPKKEPLEKNDTNKSSNKEHSVVQSKKKCPQPSKISDKPKPVIVAPVLSEREKCVTTGFNITTLDGHNDLILKIIIVDEYFVTASRDSTVKVWKLSDGTELESLRGHRGYVTSLTALPSQLSSNIIASLKAKEEYIDSSEESLLIVSGGQDCFLYVWNILTGNKLLSVYTYNGITALGCCKDGVVCGTEGGKVEVWDLGSSSLKHYINVFTGPVVDIVVENDKIIAGTSIGEVGVFTCRVEEKQLNIIYLMEHESSGFVPLRRMTSLACHGTKIYLGDSGSNIKVLDYQIRSVCRLRSHNENLGMVDCIYMNEDDYLVSSSYDLDLGYSRIHFHDGLSEKYYSSVAPDQEERILTLAVTKGVERIVTGGQHLKLWVKKRISQDDKLTPSLVRSSRYLDTNVSPVETDTEVESDWASSSDDEDDPEPKNNSEETSSSSWCNIL